MPDNTNDEEVPRYTVVGAGAQINTVDGTAVLVTRNGPVPSNVDPDHLRHLLDTGLVAEAEPVGGLEPVLTGDHTVVVTHPIEGVAGERVDDATLAGLDVDDEDAEDADGDEVPPKSASRERLEQYARAHGMSDEEIASHANKDDLRVALGGK